MTNIILRMRVKSPSAPGQAYACRGKPRKPGRGRDVPQDRGASGTPVRPGAAVFHRLTRVPAWAAWNVPSATHLPGIATLAPAARPSAITVNPAHFGADSVSSWAVILMLPTDVRRLWTSALPSFSFCCC